MATPRSPNSIIVNINQRGNPLLKYLRNIPWCHDEIHGDYEVGPRHGCIFLSLRYHRLHPTYIYDRIRSLGDHYLLRILLVQVDQPAVEKSLRELTRLCMSMRLTMLVAWSPEEAARYLETLKAFERKPADLIKERLSEDHVERMQEVLTRIKTVNKTDAMTLISNVGSFADLAKLDREALASMPGFGPQKVNALFHYRFVTYWMPWMLPSKRMNK